MAEMNEIFTRLQLKIDTYTNWTKSDATTQANKTNADLVLLKGEPAFCEIPTGNTEATTAPTILFKVGDGITPFKELKWASGLAADVYAWAKKPNPDWTDFPALPIEVVDTGIGKFITDFTYADNKLTITRSDVQWTDVKNAPDFALKSELPTTLGVMSVAKKDNTAIEVDNTDAANPKVGLKIDAAAGDVTLTQTNNGLKAELNKTAITGAVVDGDTGFVTGDAVHAAIADSTHVYKATNTNTVKANKTTEGNETTFSFDVVAEDWSGLLTNRIQIVPEQWSGGVFANQDVSLEYNADTMTYTIYQNHGVDVAAALQDTLGFDKVKVGEINIPKDMVVKSGEVVTKTEAGTWGEAGTYIALTLANATNDTIYINASNLIEYVTSGSKTGDMIVVDISNDHKVTATITDGAVTKAKLASDVQKSLDRADAVISNVNIYEYNGDTVVGALAFNVNIFDETYHDGLGQSVNLEVGLKKGGVTTEAIKDSAVTKVKLSQEVKNSLNRADSAFQELNANVSYFSDTDPVVSNALSVTHSYEGIYAIGIRKEGIATEALANGAVTTQKLQGARLSTGTDNTQHIVIFNCGSSTTVI